MNNPLYEMLQRINPNLSEGYVMPHQFALFLAIVKLYEDHPNQKNWFHINSELEDNFNLKFKELAPEVHCTSSSIEEPFYHLQKTGFWFLHIKSGKNSEYENIMSELNAQFTKHLLLDIFSHVSLSEQVDHALRNPLTRDGVIKFVSTNYHEVKTKQLRDYPLIGQHLSGKGSFSNEFVGYLNSLQRSGGGNENAMAESQACNTQFSSIHVTHPLAKTIFDELSNTNGKHVILTGHAGDGKSTIALEVYKLFNGISEGDVLKTPLKPRENVEKYSVSILKDLSERIRLHDADLLSELKSKDSKFLLVSNTGTLLDLIKNNSNHFNADEVILESKVLDAISSESGEANLDLETTHFRVFNLARMDNLKLAKRIFKKMIALNRWVDCKGCAFCASCPIYINVELIQNNQDRVLERIFLVYRRMYEYGVRLTIRQYTEHLSYLLTSGLDEADVKKIYQQSLKPLILKYLFFNRFFGDDGCSSDASALKMKTIRALKKQGFGVRPYSRWEHRLWLRNSAVSFKLGVEPLDDEFERLRGHGSKVFVYEGMSADHAREQVRRMMYFLYEFQKDELAFISNFLNSPTLLDWQSWQGSCARLSFKDKTTLEQKIYHVIQEHFTGIRLPEGSTQNDRRLYITLSRRRHEVRQSAQVVLAEVDWSTAISLELIQTDSASGESRKDLVLTGKDRIARIDLPLKVPFLDYVMMRHFGEIGEVLETSYFERLDRFKAQVLERASAAGEDRIMLVRLKMDHSFRRQHFAITNNSLEVTDVL